MLRQPRFTEKTPGSISRNVLAPVLEFEPVKGVDAERSRPKSSTIGVDKLVKDGFIENFCKPARVRCAEKNPAAEK